MRRGTKEDGSGTEDGGAMRAGSGRRRIGLLSSLGQIPFLTKRNSMPKPNYAFAKRQRDLAKKQKKEEKRLKKAAVKEAQAGEERGGQEQAEPTAEEKAEE
jgi:hypothetical protein